MVAGIFCVKSNVLIGCVWDSSYCFFRECINATSSIMVVSSHVLATSAVMTSDGLVKKSFLSCPSTRVMTSYL